MNRPSQAIATENGFSLVEFLISSAIFVLMGGYMFSVMAEMERTASYQTEVQEVAANTRMAMEVVQRYIRHAGNNPRGIAIQGVTIAGADQVRLQADLTGSSLTDPNRGDPDGDVNDLDEDVTLRYNAAARTIEIFIPANGTVRTVAGFITAFTMQYLDQFGAATAVGNDVRSVQVTISGGSRTAHPQTHQTYGTTEVCSVQLVSQ